MQILGLSIKQVLTECPPGGRTRAGSLPAALSPARNAGASGTWRSSPATLVVKLFFVAKT